MAVEVQYGGEYWRITLDGKREAVVELLQRNPYRIGSWVPVWSPWGRERVSVIRARNLRRAIRRAQDTILMRRARAMDHRAEIEALEAALGESGGDG